MEKDNFFDVITEFSEAERLDAIIIQNTEYKESHFGVEKAIQDIEEYNFTQEEKLCIDRLVSAYVAQSATYASLTYRQGFKDCASLLREINILK